MAIENAMENKVKKLDLESATAFFEKKQFKIKKGFEPKGNAIGCIDDRAERGEGHAEQVALPGSGLGLLLATFSALEKIKEEYNLDFTSDFNFKVAEKVEQLVGVSLHTDAKNKEHSSLACAGCGHCAGILNSPELLNKDFNAFVQEKYLPKLKDENVEPVVYEGGHNANAVFVIDDLETGLASHSRTMDAQVYVYNKAWHEKILNEIGEILYAEFNGMIPRKHQEGAEAEKEEEKVRKFFADSIYNSAEKQLQHTLARLTFGLPKFLVKDGQVTEITEYKDDQAEA